MKITFVCLVNSNKEKGRCIAGIEIRDGVPLLVDGKPKWVRPVCNTVHGEIPSHLVWFIRLLDIVEIEATSPVPEGFQTENVRFAPASVTVKGSFPMSSLSEICFPRDGYIFGNSGKAVAGKEAISPAHSLMLIKIEEFHVTRITHSASNTSQVRLQFSFHQTAYDFPVTDPVFVDRYRLDKDILRNENAIYVTISLGILFEGLHYKLIAAIFH